MRKQLFLNLPIADLKRSVDFFEALGFKFNPQFTDEQGTCMVIADNISVMLLEHEKFSSFIKKPIASAEQTEVILSISCDSGDEVRHIAEKAFALGGKQVNDFEDNGFMVSWGFEDLDGHLWDLFWFNPEQGK